jgi:hypothetical protein
MVQAAGMVIGENIGSLFIQPFEDPISIVMLAG